MKHVAPEPTYNSSVPIDAWCTKRYATDWLSVIKAVAAATACLCIAGGYLRFGAGFVFVAMLANQYTDQALSGARRYFSAGHYVEWRLAKLAQMVRLTIIYQMVITTITAVYAASPHPTYRSVLIVALGIYGAVLWMSYPHGLAHFGGRILQAVQRWTSVAYLVITVVLLVQHFSTL